MLDGGKWSGEDFTVDVIEERFHSLFCAEVENAGGRLLGLGIC